MLEIIKNIIDIIKSWFKIKELSTPQDLKNKAEEAIKSELDIIKIKRDEFTSSAQMTADQLIQELEAKVKRIKS